MEHNEVPVEQTDAVEGVDPEGEAPEDALSVCEAKLKEAEDKFLRTYADFENTKKRLEREKYQAIDYANEKFAKDLLGVVDALELALQHSTAEADTDKIREGVSLTLENLLKALERNGITPIAKTGEFDPNKHEAVMQMPSPDHEDGHIAMTMQTGYLYRERVLRPALVSVCKN